jgi:hypothetical protein
MRYLTQQANHVRCPPLLNTPKIVAMRSTRYPSSVRMLWNCESIARFPMRKSVSGSLKAVL